ncbi:MAG: glycosyltransferase [Cyanobacteria bacterium P01_A01_bin.116]
MGSSSTDSHDTGYQSAQAKSVPLQTNLNALNANSIKETIHAYQRVLFCGIKNENIDGKAKKSDLWVTLGDLFGEIEQWTDAIASYQNARSLSDQEPKIHYKLGNACLKNRNTVEAISAYKQAVALQPTFPAAYLAMGNALALENKISPAIACYTTVIEQDKQNVAAYKNLSALFSLQDNQAGLAFCNHHLTELNAEQNIALDIKQNIEPTIKQAEPQPQRLPSSTTQPDPHSKPLNASTQLPPNTIQPDTIQPDTIPSVENFVTPHTNRQDNQLANLYQAISLKPNSAKSYVQLADALAQKGKLNQAIAFYKIALKLNPTDFQIALQLKKSLDALSTTSRNAKSALTQLDLPTHPQTHLPGFPPNFRIPPATGEHNNYTVIEQKMRSRVASAQPYHLPVSIIIPTYNRKAKLAKVLAALTHQTYPQELIEVIVADDGSNDDIETVIEKYQSHLNLVHVRQPDLGFRLAAVCNLGMQAAKHNFFIFLQCDMIPQPQVVEVYMQYFHVAENVFLIGGRQFVCTDHITDDQILTDIGIALNLPQIKTNNEMWKGHKSWQDWRLPLYEKTERLKTERYPYQAVVGSNLAFPKQLKEKIGGFCEDFHDWGGEDREFGYRAYNAGYYFIPVHKAQCLHQEPPNGVNETDRHRGQKAAQVGCQAKCPLLLDRAYQPGRTYEIPKVSLFINLHNGKQNENASHTKQALQSSIESVLTQTYTDLELVILHEKNSSITQMLEENYKHTPRIKWIIQPEKTKGKAYTQAIETGHGPYIGPLTLGNILNPTAIETLVHCLDQGLAGCVFGNYQVIDTGRTLKKLGPPLPDNSRESLIRKMLTRQFCLFRKRDWGKIANSFPEFNLEFNDATDYALALKLAEVCSFQYVDQVLFSISHTGQRCSQADLWPAQKQQHALEMAKVANWLIH